MKLIVYNDKKYNTHIVIVNNLDYVVIKEKKRRKKWIDYYLWEKAKDRI